MLRLKVMDDLNPVLKNFLGIFRVTKDYKIYFVLACILMVLNVVLETIGLSVVLPLVDLFANTPSQSTITQHIREVFAYLNIAFSPVNVLMIFLGIRTVLPRRSIFRENR